MPRRAALLALLLALSCGPAAAGTPPPGFVETVHVSGIFQLTGFDWAPNGDLWVIGKDGRIRVLRSGSSTPTFIRKLTVDPNGERGLVGLAVDPGFAANQFIYFYYTATTPAAHNRVSRFRANGDSLQDETILLEGPDLESFEHNSGNLRFGLDGTLYIAMGDNRQPAMAQEKGSLLGKILRINPDGTIPQDNPFVNDPNARHEVWAYGFRNPYRFSVDPLTGTLAIGDVGEVSWEELDLGIPGANYGHPLVEGPEPPGVAGITYPLFSYSHNGSGAAIIAGDNMVPGNFPAQYAGDYFYGDFSLGKIFRLDLDAAGQPVTNETFVQGVPFPVHVRVGPDGALYYASINFQTIYRTAWVGGSNTQPTAVASAVPASGLAPLTVQFDASGSSDPDPDPLTYNWSFGDGGTSTAVAPIHTYQDAGAWTATLTVNDTHVTSNASLRIVSGNRAPTATILVPANGASFNAGEAIDFSGEATDPEEGSLGPAAFSWTVFLRHNTHFHPYLGPLSGMTAGSFETEAAGETDPNIAYEIRLTASDTGSPVGPVAVLSDTRTVTLLPNLSTMTFAAAPLPGLALTLDSHPIAPPLSVVGVVGIQRVIEAPSPQSPGDGHTYRFASWSDGRARSHAISTPATDTIFTATFGCDLLEEVTDLVVAPAPAGEIALEWSPVADPCLSSGPVLYRVYSASTPIPSSSPGSFPADPAFTLIGATMGTTMTVAPTGANQFFLVVGIGSDGAEGPVGAYGR
ncbi:MAG TPA: PQQ-dependent sugar dehydrogenase [Candidatus Polarisedimenticolia bacterium]|jgi:glucose/arabinose dehydrogenase